MLDQLVSPDEYANLNLSDMWIEDAVQRHEAKWLLKHTREDEAIIDMGFGSGIVCKALHDAKRNVVVVDGSKRFTDMATAQGIPAHLSMFETFTPFCEHDTVIASFVLEHVQDPVALLMRARTWAKRLIVVVGNAHSYHRQLAVKMGIQPRLDSLSARDKLVGHYIVYDMTTITRDLLKSGWAIKETHGLMLKVLPNSMLANLAPELIEAMTALPVPAEIAANICLICERR